ncbi:ABC transporter substrate-binding protein [Vallitalea pronyensis]|uniref:ABC transporter substrate-binding protein n=1 Tax=Vallitalea pronyensis TaxID=1348613 RepID=A0A8J8SH11_9FIRM|nr:ABC transporter substrate-binding protein [Vallitalea pronyensis]QUI23126.1 ABC transporter substrate-binding protein [Vallitalea pronyensis]
MKKLSIILVIMLLLVSVVGCSKTDEVKEGDQEQAPTELVISTWGYSEDLLWENVFTPFEEANNVKIILETGNNSERLIKLKSNPDSNIDLIYLAEAFAQEGIEAGLFEKIDYDKVTNSDKVGEKAAYLIEAGYGPAYTLNRAAIAYDPNKVGFDIQSWDDLWHADLKGKVSIPEITTTFGPSTMYVASNYKAIDITSDNGDAAFVALEELKPNLVKTYSKSSDLANMFANEEIAVAITADFAYGRVKDGAPDVVFVNPEEGAYINFNTINIVKASKNKELALKFIDYALSTEVQTRTAKALGESPINTEVELTEEEAENLTYGDVINQSNTVDHEFINAIKTQWIDRWNRTLNQ